jgi:hypothetical protein
MPLKKNPLKLNKLQLRTLALAQVLAKDPETGLKDEKTECIALTSLPHGHGNHVHVGGFTVSSKDASGFANPAVWSALERKGLSIPKGPLGISLTVAALEYDTGLGNKFLAHSDH